jgi:translation initiation factor 1
MSRRNRDRLPTNQPQQPLQNLGAALGKPPEPRPEEDLSPPQGAEVPLWKCGRVVLRRETAHRGGKVVVVVDQFASHLPLSFIEKTARQLRQACGVGGTVKGRTIEIQGEQLTNVRTTLIELGFEVAGVR